MATEQQCNEITTLIAEKTGLSEQDSIEQYCEFLRENSIDPESRDGIEFGSDDLINPDYWNCFLMHVNHSPTSIRKDVIERNKQKELNDGK